MAQDERVEHHNRAAEQKVKEKRKMRTAMWKSLTVALITVLTASAFVPPAATAASKQLTFTLKPGGSKSFALPVTGVPVRIEVSFSLMNGGTQTPSEIMYAVVNQDPSSNQETWVGTNSNGTQTACNTVATTNCLAVADAPFSPSSTIIAVIFGGSPDTDNASLVVSDQASGLLEIEQNASTTSVDGHYVVNLWW